LGEAAITTSADDTARVTAPGQTERRVCGVSDDCFHRSPVAEPNSALATWQPLEPEVMKIELIIPLNPRPLRTGLPNIPGCALGLTKLHAPTRL
jgi:hypothetical protein